MKIMVKKALLEKSIFSRIQKFSVFVENTVNNCFQSIRPNVKLNINNLKMIAMKEIDQKKRNCN